MKDMKKYSEKLSNSYYRLILMFSDLFFGDLTDDNIVSIKGIYGAEKTSSCG